MSESLAPTEIAKQVKRRRTFAIISHPDAGKTTLTEKLLLFSGAIQIAGRERKGSGLDIVVFINLGSGPSMRLRMNDVILRLASRRRSPLGCGLPVLSDDLHHVSRHEKHCACCLGQTAVNCDQTPWG